MKEKTPQEKKALSYARDRRNNYHANDKASRKLIPKRKAGVNRVYRRNVSDALKEIVGSIDLDAAAEAEHSARSIKRDDWRKTPDAPLGAVVEQKLENRQTNAGKGKTLLKKTRMFIEDLEVDVKQIAPDRWAATAKGFPHIKMESETRARAIDKLKHVMTVAMLNELGPDNRAIMVQIDGEMITPVLSK